MIRRVHHWSITRRSRSRTPAGQYAVAFIVLAAATAFRASMIPLVGMTAIPFISYFPAVVAASLYGGLGPGLLVTALAALLAQYYFIAPSQSLGSTATADVVALLMFLAASVIIVLLNELRHRAMEEARLQHSLADQRATQLQFEIEERDRARKEAADAQRWAQDTLSSIGDGVICADLNGNITFLNSIAEDLTRWTHAEAAGKPVTEVFRIVCEATRQPVEGPIRKVLEQGVNVALGNQTLLIRRDGSEVPIDDSVAPIRSSSQQVVGAVLVFRDVTEKKVLEQELRSTASRLENSNQDLLAFAYTVSHDLQDPLRNVSTFSELLQNRYGATGQLDREGQGYLDFIVKGSSRMHAMLRDLMAWSSAVNSTSGVFTGVRIEEAVHWAEQNLVDRIRETGAAIRIYSSPEVAADHVQLVHLFQNLIGNAIKYRSEAPPIIEIRAWEEATHWHVTVSDNGRGISPADQKVVFNLFQRGKESQSDGLGSGVGLAICKRIVQRHDGEIWVDSSPGLGSTVHFTLLRRTAETRSAARS